MRRYFGIAVTLSVLASAAPVLAQSQLALSAGLTPEQANGMTLNEIAAVKFNRESSRQDQQVVVAERVPGSNPDLEMLAITTYNGNKSHQDRLVARDPTTVSSMAFQNPSDVATHYQLIRAAGLTPEEAEGMTLNQIVHINSPD